MSEDNIETKDYLDETSFILENGIEKPISETRHFKYIELANKLHVLLISDETTDTSLASMSVGVGSVNEPNDTLGLAHFVEHLLFMGTKRHPEENEYSKFIEGHNGYNNAYTDTAETNYYFDISNDYYDEALELFSEFFICPLFNEDSLMREKQAVHSEYVMNLQNDHWRIQEMKQVACNQNHPYSRFTVGTETTLGADNIRARAMEFYHKYYSANIMNLVLLSCVSLEELEILAHKYFDEVPNFNVEKPIISNDIISKEAIGSIYKIIPVNDKKQLFIHWILPSTRDCYLSNELHFLSHLIGHEAEGSLASYLKSHNYVTSLGTECTDQESFMTSFSITLTLTEYGFEHYYDIITFIYQYIYMLQTIDIPEHLYREMHEINNIEFKFLEKDNDTDNIATFASYLDRIPYRYILHISPIYRHFDRKSIQTFIHLLNINNMIVQIASRSFSFTDYQVEKYYDIHYKREILEESLLQKWKNPIINSAFHLPCENPFIPRDLHVIEENTHGDENEIPIHIVNTPGVSLYLKNTTPFNVPKMSISILINSIYTKDTPEHYIKTMLLLKYAFHQVNEYLYYAELADCAYDYHMHRGHGAVLEVQGFHDHIPLILTTLLNALTNISISEKVAEDLKNSTIANLKSKRNIAVYKRIGNYFDCFLYHEHKIDDLLIAVEHISLQEIKEHAILLFNNCKIEGLLTGNVSQSAVLIYKNLIETSLHPTGIQINKEGKQVKGLEEHLIKIPMGMRYIYNTLNYNKDEKNCGCGLYMTVCSYNTLNIVVQCRLFQEIIKNEIYDTLRTKEQLGYVIYTVPHNIHGYCGLMSVVQSDNKSSGYVYGRLISFFKEIHTFIEDLDDDDFEEYKESVYDQYTEKINNISTLHMRYSKEIHFNTYLFDRSKQYADIVMNITKEQILHFYNTYINPESSTTQYAVFLINNQELGKEQLPEDNHNYYIDDLNEFYKTCDVYPIGYEYM